MISEKLDEHLLMLHFSYNYVMSLDGVLSNSLKSDKCNQQTQDLKVAHTTCYKYTCCPHLQRQGTNHHNASYQREYIRLD